MAAAGAQAVTDITVAVTTFIAHERIARLAIEHRLALFGAPTPSPGLFTYGVEVSALPARAAEIVDRLLKGAKPSDIPVEQVSS